MINKVRDFIKNHCDDKGILFVIKGYPLKKFKDDEKSFEEIREDKFTFFMSIFNMYEKIISFDEFLLVYDFAIAQFKQIYVLENDSYLNLYPLDISIPSDIISNLVAHFDEDIQSEIPLDDLQEYINIYNNVIETSEGIAVSYNITEIEMKNQKIERIVFNKEINELQEIQYIEDESNYLNLCFDEDYFLLVQGLANNNKKYYVTWENYISGKEVIHNKLQLLSFLHQNRIYSYLKPQKPTKVITSRPEVYEILNKYWEYKLFRNLKVYDLLELEDKTKKVVEISQEIIINDVIEQVENCVNKKNYKDIFITAPTGAGKSLMFQIPAIYLAEKYNLLTIVITPLIGLMKDQVKTLEKKNYNKAKTINSDIPPIIKDEILKDVSEGNCDILYLSPESLLSKSDIQQLIGNRKIGMIIIDESHIVTTWGKQFRPDYWYLGDYVRKLRKAQANFSEDSFPFIIATFTATAIYEGTEDMYHETINSMQMVDPITYLGYLKRDNISIEVSEVEAKKNKVEYEINKFDDLIEMIHHALARSQKTLIYFPTVALIDRFYSYCYSKDLTQYVAKYNGQMSPDEKDQNFNAFYSSQKLIMLATKAFGMGIDIPDIGIVSHFAPTGNVCDYMQEIGRAARDKDIEGHAIYKHMSNDFKHINKLHGLSAIRKYQLIEVIKKILELYLSSRYSSRKDTFTKKRNEMLVDAECFSYIFENARSDDSDLINKVKTAMLLIQKDYDNRGFSPFYMRPIPLFSHGYFSIDSTVQKKLNSIFKKSVEEINSELHVCKVNLQRIWDDKYSSEMSFPKFKYLLYTNSVVLDFNAKFSLRPAMEVEVYQSENHIQTYNKLVDALKKIINRYSSEDRFVSLTSLIHELSNEAKINSFKAESIIGVFLATIDLYQQHFSNNYSSKLVEVKISTGDKVSYRFRNTIRLFFKWIEKGYNFINAKTVDEKMYIVDDINKFRIKEIITIFGFLEALGVLRFKTLGGSNSQIYIYVNETKRMQMVKDKPHTYQNRLLDLINQRHEDSVKMLTFLFSSNLTSDEIWNHLENYFLGILPEKLHFTPSMPELIEDSVSIKLELGENTKEYYSSWAEVQSLFDSVDFSLFYDRKIPLPEYFSSMLIVEDQKIDSLLVWPNNKTIISSGDESAEIRNIATNDGWRIYPINKIDIDQLVAGF